ncbi:DUF6345 domain-containing protein [Methanoculleus sp.]|uniref:DUF6345 domain-containing protein n=1 Tax=Methanoculleus sp. TaxID=90427 RepID=UPI0025F0695D|nr:DUF6345 domain-containing protein [Methanoculleus sp.]
MMEKRKIERSILLAGIVMGMILAPPACAGTGDDNDASYPEFGVEYKCNYLAGNNQPSSPTSAEGFREALSSAGWTESFFIGDEDRNVNRWTYSGLDQSYVDGTDIVYFAGHGWNQGILLNSAPGSWVYFRNCEWGDYDLEWMLLDSCHTVQLPSELKYYPHHAMNGVSRMRI